MKQDRGPNTASFHLSCALTVGASLALAACSGGGSDSTPIAANSAPAVITADNYTQAAGAAVAMSGQAQGGTSSKAGTTSRALQHSRALMAAAPSRAVDPGKATPTTQTVACADGGSATYTIRSAVAGTYSTGDSYDYSYASCGSAEGAVYDGRMVYRFNQVTSYVDEGHLDYDVSIDYEQVHVRDKNTGDDLTVGGSLRDHSVRTGFKLGTDHLTVDRLAATGQEAGQPRSIEMTGYVADVTYTSGQVSWTESATVNDSALGGTLVYATVTPFVQFDGNEFPSSGVGTVTGAHGSKVTVTAMPGGRVRLDYDATGDGVIDRTSYSTWAELEF